MSAAFAFAPSPAPPQLQARLAISLIIPTRDRPFDLLHALQSVQAQTSMPPEVVIVDQSHSRNRAVEAMWGEWLRARGRGNGATTPHLMYLHEPGLRGSSAGRNRGLEVAQGAICLFLDDDVILEPHFIAALLCAYRQHPEAAGISGIVSNYASPSLPRRWGRRLFMLGPFWDDRQPIYWRAEQLRGSPPLPVSRLGGGLMSFRRETITGLSFATSLPEYSIGEDVDFCLRLAPNRPLFVAPGARLRHNHSGHGAPRCDPIYAAMFPATFLYCRHWRRGWQGRLCYLWLNVGLTITACAAMVRQGSRAPWKSLRAGYRDARRAAAEPPAARAASATFPH